ncbi:MAG TPA: glutamate synthase subunit alpha, partial [Acidimicrobiia bacterium]|nr:glutamate synthase subunit alpha [Acidimicrobiia bacterium]
MARLDGVPSHEAVQRGLTALANMEHRGAEGADADTGDGAGMLVQIPDRFFRATCDFPLPGPGRYAVAVCFLPDDARRRQTLEWLLVEKVTDAGLEILAWRDVPVRPEAAGRVARETAPVIRQLFSGAPEAMDGDAFERALYLARRRAELASADGRGAEL